MSFQVIFYKFSKKINSTEKPTLALEPNTLFSDVVLKDDTNVLNPTLLIKSSFIDLSNGKFYTPNYVYIEEFKRYYYVVNMTWVKGAWQIQCKVDVLASYKDEIGAQSLYVTRSSAQSDGNIIDTTYPAEGVPTIINQVGALPWNLDQDNGYCYVMGIAGQSTTYYAFTLSQLQVFLDFVMSDDYVDALYGGTGWTTAFEQIKALTNPLQYITSIKWYPFEISGTPVTSIRLGWVTMNVAGGLPRKITNFLNSTSQSTTINNKHPQASRGIFLNRAPYSSYRILYPGFGQIDLDSAVVAKSASIFTNVIVDVRSGEGTLYIEDDSSYILNQISSQVGVEYQVGQVTKQGFGVGAIAQTGLSALGNAATGNIGGTIGSIVGGVGDYVKSQIPSIRTIGSNGGVNNLFGAITLQSEFKLLVTEDNTRKGRPLCEIKTINTLTGFIQVDKADVDIATMEGEQNEIRSYMEGGFYYE